MNIVECTELTKVYGRHNVALHNLNLTIEQGQAFGLLGENGAGKSTLVRLLMGFIFPTSGHIRVLGEEQVVHVHKHVGYVHERPFFEPRISGRQYLAYLGQLSGLWDEIGTRRIQMLLSQVHLEDVADRLIETYSKGMLQRLAIAQALLTDPELFILDEPTSGLDPRSQWEIRQIIGALNKAGKTILLCSHYLTEVEEICNTVGILRRGEMILHGSVGDLLRTQDVVEIVLAQERSASEVALLSGLNNLMIETHTNILRIPGREQARVLAYLLEKNIAILSLNPLSRSLEEVYVQAIEETDTLAHQVSAGKTHEKGDQI
jgi:ABC-2 type transport system ATP-binding protein